MKILGLNAYHADASAALFVDGELAYAIEEERLNRKKHCAGFTALAARRCLELAGVRPQELDHVAVSRDPRVHLGHKALHVVERALHGGGRALLRQVRERLHNHQRVQRLSEVLAAALGAAPRRRQKSVTSAVSVAARKLALAAVSRSTARSS